MIVCPFTFMNGGHMGLVSKANAKKLKSQVTTKVDLRAVELETAIIDQFNEFHSKNYFNDPKIEQLLVDQMVFDIKNDGWFKPNGMPMFSPSGASKCERELCLKAMKGTRDEHTMFPYQRRWVRNSSAVHAVVQRDIIYMSQKMKDPSFKTMYTSDGLPMWEKNNAQYKEFEHNGVKFAIAGMMDGQLCYTKDGTIIGFEFKTKTNSVAQVGPYKMKESSEQHRQQCIAYSLLFGLDEFILFYEAVAKDSWMVGATARPDIRAFYVKVTEAERVELLDKYARVASSVQSDELLPMELNKCLFCEYKGVCGR